IAFVAGARAQGQTPVDAPAAQPGPPVQEVRPDSPAQDPGDAARAQAAPVGPTPPAVEVPNNALESIARAPLPTFHPADPSSADAALLLGALANAAPDVASSFELGLASDGRPVPAIEIAARGDVPKAERPTVFLIGALDGRSAAGAESVMGIVHQLLEAPDRIPADVTIVAVPWASPDGLDVLPSPRVSADPNL